MSQEPKDPQAFPADMSPLAEGGLELRSSFEQAHRRSPVPEAYPADLGLILLEETGMGKIDVNYIASILFGHDPEEAPHITPPAQPPRKPYKR